MTTNERDAVATLCLMAAFADGRNDERERTRLRDVFASLDAGFSPARTERVLLGHASLDDEAARLTTPAVRALAYEMAVGICDADGRADAAEQAFLDRLRHALGLDPETASEIDAVGDALALPPADADAHTARTGSAVPTGTLATGDGAASGVLVLAAPEEVIPAAHDADAALDGMILRYAVLNGGLELLPQKIATLAVIPMQTKMVYRVGLHYGHQLDQGHAKELLATVGLGLTSQVAETYARGLFGGLAQATLGKAMGGKKKGKKGKKAKTVAAAATGSAFTFAATYALGHAAKAYYGGGRRLSTDALRGLFERHAEQGRSLYQTHRPAVEERARTTDLRALMAELRPV
ncbi:MAG: tellurite resistance TerB family protein [Rhodothermales bacterium]